MARGFGPQRIEAIIAAIRRETSRGFYATKASLALARRNGRAAGAARMGQRFVAKLMGQR